jgi:hypothetical protein
VFSPADFADIAGAIIVRKILVHSLGWTNKPTGNSALNALELSTQIPDHWKT